MSYKTIVVGTDGSPTATVAVEVAQKLAKRLRGRLVLVGALDAYGITRQPLQTALFEAAEAARAKKVDATAELIEGTPGESILGAAVKHDADLIVVGNRGMGQATRFRLGSVPDWVAHDAPCDLLIVDTTGRAARAGASLHADPRGDGRLGDGDRGRAQGLHARLGVRGLGDARARRRSARRRDQARRGGVGEAGGRRGREANSRGRSRPTDL